MVKIRRKNDNSVYTAKSVKQFIINNESIFGEFTQGKRKSLSQTLQRGSWYKGFQVVENGNGEMLKNKEALEHANFKHDHDFSSKGDLLHLVRTQNLLPIESTILDVKGHYTSEVANIDVFSKNSDKPVRSYRKRATDEAELSILYTTGNGVVKRTTAITDCETGTYITPEFIFAKIDEVEEEEIKRVEGEVESKPKFDSFGDEYHIYSKNRKPLIITKDFLRNFKLRYCVDKLTINQMTIELGLVRDEVHLIKTAFGITKDDIPFIDEDIDGMDADEMAEAIRREKKRAFGKKLHKKKYDDIEKEVKKLHNKEHVIDTVLEALKGVKPLDETEYIVTDTHNFNKFPTTSENTIFKFEDKKREIIVPVTDTHIGMVAKNIHNSFNYSIAKDRMWSLAKETLKLARECKVERVNLEFLGDYVHGEIHDSQYKENEFGIAEQVKASVELFGMLIKRVSNEFPVNVTMVGGNHDRMNKEKSANSQNDSWHIIIKEWLKTMFMNRNVVFTEDKSFNLSEIKMFDYSIIGHHGHEGKTAKKVIEYLSNTGTRILEIHKGHLHRKSETNYGFMQEIIFPSFCGVDTYAETNVFSGYPSVEIRIYDKEGLFGTHIVRFKK